MMTDTNGIDAGKIRRAARPGAYRRNSDFLKNTPFSLP